MVTDNLESIFWVVNLAGDFHRLVVQVGFVQRLGVVESIVVDLWVKLSQLLVTVSRVNEVIQLIVAVGQQ